MFLDGSGFLLDTGGFLELDGCLVFFWILDLFINQLLKRDFSLFFFGQLLLYFFFFFGNTNDDTDGDNIPNFLDTDDDGDGYSTLFEIQENGVKVFPYPTCDSGIPKYLDKSCHPPKKTN